MIYLCLVLLISLALLGWIVWRQKKRIDLLELTVFDSEQYWAARFEELKQGVSND